MESVHADSLISSLEIRHVLEDDLTALEWEGEYSHFRQLYHETYSRTLTGNTLMWVATLPQAGIIGQVFIQLSCDRLELANGIDRAYLYAFRIKGPYRSRGIGSRVMDFLEDDLRTRRYTWLTLNVAHDNLRARQLYERLGFHVVAHEPGHWHYTDNEGITRHVTEPAWRMEKYLQK